MAPEDHSLLLMRLANFEGQRSGPLRALESTAEPTSHQLYAGGFGAGFPLAKGWLRQFPQGSEEGNSHLLLAYCVQNTPMLVLFFHPHENLPRRKTAFIVILIGQTRKLSVRHVKGHIWK